MEDAWKAWKDKPTPANLGTLLTAAEPSIQSGLKSYGGGNPSLKTKAKLLAIDAFKSYDPNKGTKLSTHLMTGMQPLIRHQREASSVTRVPERVAIDLYRLHNEHNRFRDEMSRDPSDTEIADRTGMSLKRIRHVRTFSGQDRAESALQDEDGGMMMPGVAKADPHKIWLEYVHHDLGPIDQKIMEWKTGHNGSQILENQEIAKRLNLTPGAVSQRSSKIAAKVAEMEAIDG